MTPIGPIAVCIAIAAGADEVRVRDLFGGADETVVALAPAPGVQRRFELAELRRIAARLHLTEPEREACVERPVAPLDPARLIEAMRAELRGARIEVLDYSRQPVPEGELQFPRAGLRRTTGGAVWNGWIRYGGRRRFNTWARVNVTVSEPRVVASADLPAGRPIAADALRVETRDQFPESERRPSTIAEIEGRIPRRTIRAGTPIEAAWLDAPKAVARGETVHVEVREGGAVLQISGQAQGSGTVGQTILVLNPMSNKRFPARIDAPGRVSAGGSR
jgi:flagella basal body P-ring formation protein FlgA